MTAKDVGRRQAVSERSSKPHAKPSDVRKILETPGRPLTASERKQRTSFYDEFGQDAVPVEPATFARGRSSGSRFRNH